MRISRKAAMAVASSAAVIAVGGGIGTAFALAGNDAPARPATGATAPVRATVSVSSSASRAAVPVAAVSPSTTKTAAPVHVKPRAVTNQGAPAVTDPTPQDPQPSDTTTAPAPGSHGGPLRHGPTDAPSTSVDYAYPTESSSAQEQN